MKGQPFAGQSNSWMKTTRSWHFVLAALLLVFAGVPAGLTPTSAENAESPYARWENGPPSDPDFFPIGVWLQAPANAPRFKAIGINTYAGLHRGPTEAQLAELRKHGMRVICHQNEAGLRHKADRMIIAWMHGDEPDNAHPIGSYWKSSEQIEAAWPDAPRRSLEQWGKWGPPIPPKTIIDNYHLMRGKDPSRPVWLNLGQGVAWDGWHGRGIRTNKPEDYPQYMQGADIVSFDIYPANQTRAEVKDQLWMVPFGVKRLREWSGNGKPIWNVVESTGYDSPDGRPTPEQVRAQVWMSLIHGSKGIIYFAHVFSPKFIEAGLLADREMTEAVAALNRQIQDLAPVLNSPAVEGLARVSSSNEEVPLALMTKRHGGAIYLFAAAMGDGPTRGRFTIEGLEGNVAAEVLGEERIIQVAGGQFADEFQGYGVHLYKIMY
jgi:hypothetical protein